MMKHVAANVSAVMILAINLLSVCAEDTDSNSLKNVGERTADRHALHAVFQDDSLQDNTLFIHQTASAMPLDKRYKFLSDWVLPNDDHPTFRVTGEFSSTNPPPFSEQPSDVAARLNQGVVVMSPAAELVDAARKLDRLKELQKRIGIAEVSADDVQQYYAKATLQFLVDVASEDFGSATTTFDRVIAQSAKLDAKSVVARWPALLMLRAVISSSDNDVRRHVTEFFFSIYMDLKEYSPNSERDVLNDHLRTMFALNLFIGKDASIEYRPVELSEQWLPFSYSDSETRGHGRPAARWSSERGSVHKLSGHEMDFLSFRSPLRGNFEVECNFSSVHGSHFSFMVGGSNIQAVAGGASLRMGNFRKHYTDAALDRPLTNFRSTVRFRAVVRNGVLRHYLNGQEVLQKELAPEHDPWVAMRAWRRSLGHVSDFRITGSPVIPDEFDLTGDPELSGWAPYFEEGFGPGKGNWHATEDGQSGTAIFGMRRPEFAGSAVQKLLRYCRPVAEDGTIEYEFFYKQGEACVHPALDRLAFLLDPSGVKIHWMTDRRYERFERDPANVSEEPANRRGPSQLPLREDAWNHLKLNVTGNTVQLFLNDQAIYQRTLEASNQRTFGLFHYADRTEARVRNVIWRGDWPKQMPSVKDQNLVSASLDFLDESREKLTDHFRHDFRKDPLFERFDLAGNVSGLSTTKHGTRVEILGHDGVKKLTSGLRISGDFDITATFQDLEQRMQKPSWELRAGFILHFDNELADACGLYRILARNENNRRVAFFHSSRPKDKPYTVHGEYLVEESTSGRLRMARRGSTIYALYAADDSPNFRLVDQQDVTAEPLLVQGLQMALMSAADASVGVTWKDLDVRADEISGLPLSDEATIISALNARRATLRAREISFVDVESVAEQFTMRATGTPELTPKPEGLRIANVAGAATESSVFNNIASLGPGSDVELKFDVHELGHPDSVATKSELALKVFYQHTLQGNKSPREATFILRRQTSREFELVTRIVYRTRKNNTGYRPLLAVPVKSPDSFRAVIDEGTLYFLYSEAGSDDYRIATTAPVVDGLRATGVELKFVAAGEDHRSEVTLKKLIVHEVDESQTDLND